VLGRKAKVAVAVLFLIVLGFFLYAGALDPPSRLRSRPNTATPQGFKPVATVVKP
jgi:hypothetical protein